MNASIWIVNLVVLASVLGTDLGRREVSKRRLLRPAIVAAVIVPMYLKHPATSGTGLALELGLAGFGLALGLAAAALLRIRREPATGKVFTHGGAGYAALWTAVVGARLTFSYGAQHWFGQDLGRWMYQHSVTADALTDALVLMAIAMLLGRTGTLALRKGASAGVQSVQSVQSAQSAAEAAPKHPALAR
jgi:hypothetical protein